METIQNLLRQSVNPASFLKPLGKLFAVIQNKLSRQTLCTTFQVQYVFNQCAHTVTFTHEKTVCNCCIIAANVFHLFQVLSELAPELEYITDVAVKVCNIL